MSRMRDASGRPRVARAPEAVSRRSLLSWLGNASVLALTPGLLADCDARRVTILRSRPGHAGGAGAPHSGAGGLAGAAAGESGASAGVAGAGSGDVAFPFAPSPREGALYETFFENTVDPQSLEELLSSWELVIDGLVTNPLTLSFPDLVRLERTDQTTDFHCVEGWSVLDVPWNGVHFATLAEFVQPAPDATHITLHSTRGIYLESIPLDVAREPKTLFAYGIDDHTLPLPHGFPLRLVVPRLFGYKSAKWVRRIEFTNARVTGFWEARGYSYEAEVPAARLREGKY